MSKPKRIAKPEPMQAQPTLPAPEIPYEEWPRETLRIHIAEVRAVEQLLTGIVDRMYDAGDLEQFGRQVSLLSEALKVRMDRLEETFAGVVVQESSEQVTPAPAGGEQ